MSERVGHSRPARQSTREYYVTSRPRAAAIGRDLRKYVRDARRFLIHAVSLSTKPGGRLISPPGCQGEGEYQGMTDIKTIGVLAYHRCSESDTIIPWEILTGVAIYLKNTTGAVLDVNLVALDEGDIEMQMGARVQPHAVLKSSDL